MCRPPRAGGNFSGVWVSGLGLTGEGQSALSQLPHSLCDLGHGLFSLGLAFPNCTVGEGAAVRPLPGRPFPQRRWGFWEERPEGLSALPLCFTAAGALRSVPRGRGRATPRPTQVSSFPIRQRGLIKGALPDPSLPIPIEEISLHQNLTSSRN